MIKLKNLLAEVKTKSGFEIPESFRKAFGLCPSCSHPLRALHKTSEDYKCEECNYQGPNELLNEVTVKDLNARHPHPAMPQLLNGKPDMENMTLDNLKALLDKSNRGFKSASAAGREEDAERELRMALIFHAEIKKRLAYINKKLNEQMTYNQLLRYVDNGRKDRADDVATRSIPVSVDEGVESWNFRYKSNPSTTGKAYQGAIRFIKRPKASKNAADVPCKVDCGCPDFRYRWAYNNSKEDAADIGPNTLNKCINRSPKPAYDYGIGLCKHLVALGGYLQTKIKSSKKSNLFEAIDEISKQGNFTVNCAD
jgi:predicted RNA-binding Zn-ribbon protein involved in translation (DUF1610 family)